MLLLSRLIIGISVGFHSTSIPVYIKGFAPKALTGIMGSIFQMGISFGVLLDFLLGLGYPDKKEM
jgi:MFS family permease